MKVYADITNFLTNYLQNRYLTGIQRVVSEVVKKLISEAETDTVLLDYSPADKRFRVVDNDKLYRCLKGGLSDRDELITEQLLSIDDLSPHSVFFDMDNVWNSRFVRSSLYPLLKQRGIRILTQVYDIIPIKHPEFAVESTVFNFMSYIGACIQFCDLIIVSSKAVQKNIEQLCEKLGHEPVRCRVVPLGADFKGISSSDEKDAVEPQVARAVEKLDKYILMVGTVEPRKNHKLLIDALDSGLAKKGISVVIAGKFGWNVSELRERIELHPLLNKQLFFFERPNDETIKYLYEHAFAVAFPTYDEGFGLPVIEALQLGTPVVASDIEVLREVGGEYADYFTLNDKNSLIDSIMKLASDEELYRQKKEKIKNFRPVSWDMCGENMVRALLSLENKTAAAKSDVKQLVIFSRDPARVSESLEYYDRFMPFAEKALICTSGKETDFKISYSGRLEVKVTEYKKDTLTSFADDVFILSDDDVRPLKTIAVGDFISDGSYRAFYCGRPYNSDECSRKTREFLESRCLPGVMYESHQMQIFDRDILCALYEKYPEANDGSMDIFSLYFNFAAVNYPEIFTFEGARSMCLPEPDSCNEGGYYPEKLTFEHFCEKAYEPGQPFAGFSTALNDNTSAENMEKVIIYNNAVRQAKSIADVYNSYREHYSFQYKTVPTYTVFANENKNIEITKPAYIQLKADSSARIELAFDKKLFTELDIKCIDLAYWFVNGLNEKAGSIVTVPVPCGEEKFYLSLSAPKTPGAYTIKLAFIFNYQETVKTAVNAAYIV
ncbi:MAG: glycosyltransferase family 4 protein [Huintestinicola sp.]|uniref:glycosyltransferase family 4 protein n=1 Tax=Huintestinicola sp. TaxID=2981661 RepID=UPI003F0D0553